MSLVMTLVAGPAAAAHVLPAIVERLADKLSLQQNPDTLAHDRAYDLILPAALDAEQAETAARGEICGAAIDVLVGPVAGRRKRLLVADLEATIIENEMLEELAEFVGQRAHVAEITRRAMNGELDFVAALAERVALLKGLPASVLDEAASRIRLTPGARALVSTMRKASAPTVLVSGGFEIFAERVAAELGFDRVVANRLDIANGRIAGTARAPIVTAQTKLATLEQIAGELGIPLSATLAVGDGANDLPMLQAAGLGIAFHAKPAVAAAVGRRIDHADLTAVLYAQGYRRQEIAGTG